MYAITIEATKLNDYKAQIKKTHPQAAFMWFAPHKGKYHRLEVMNVDDHPLVATYSVDNDNWTISAKNWFDFNSIAPLYVRQDGRILDEKPTGSRLLTLGAEKQRILRKVFFHPHTERVWRDDKGVYWFHQLNGNTQRVFE